MKDDLNVDQGGWGIIRDGEGWSKAVQIWETLRETTNLYWINIDRERGRRKKKGKCRKNNQREESKNECKQKKESWI